MASDTRDTRKHKEKKKTKKEKTAPLGPFHHYIKSVCVRARVCVCVCVCVCVFVFVSLRHMVIGLPSTHGMTKKAASSSSAQCRSVNKSEELVDVACASNNIFVNTAVGRLFRSQLAWPCS